MIRWKPQRRSSMMSRGGVRRATALSCVVTLTLTLGFAQPAHAGNWGSVACGGTPKRNCVSLANNSYHVVNWIGDQDIPGMGAAVNWSLANNYNPTDLVAYYDASDPYPDVKAMDEPYGDIHLWGWAECPTNNTGVGGSDPNRWCRGQVVRFNSTYRDDLYTDARRRTLACHEIAHTVGLRHSNYKSSCVYTPIESSWSTRLTTEDQDHINSYY